MLYEATKGCFLLQHEICTHMNNTKGKNVRKKFFILYIGADSSSCLLKYLSTNLHSDVFLFQWKGAGRESVDVLSGAQSLLEWSLPSIMTGKKS